MRDSHISRNVIATIAGAIIIFTSLAFPWYAIRLPDYDISWDMNFLYLISDVWGTWSLWFGSALPVIGVIICASIAFVSSSYSLFGGQKNIYLWRRLGILSAGLVLTNAIYIIIWMRNEYSEWINIINPGVILAFIGSAIMALSYSSTKK